MSPPDPGDRRIALLLPCFWPEVRRGGERIVHELGTGLARAGWEPRLITSHPGRGSLSREDGLEIVRVRRPLAARVARRGYEDHLTHVPLAAAALARGDEALAHAFHPGDGVAAAWWGARRRRPVVFTYLGIPYRSFLVARRLRLEATHRAARGADAVTALSRTAADAFWHTLGIRARVIYPGVDVARFCPGPGRAERPTIFCAAPPDAPMKRVDLLVAAVARLRRRRRDIRLVLLRPAEPALAASLAREPWIELRDPVQAPEALAPAYREAWVTALPSRGDSFGLVLAESLACGTPVVGSRLGAIPEVVDRPEIGRLFDDGAAADLDRALEEGLELSEAPATPAACRARGEEFSVARNVAQHEALYTELLDRRG